jgi:hypothetical protein
LEAPSPSFSPLSKLKSPLFSANLQKSRKDKVSLVFSVHYTKFLYRGLRGVASPNFSRIFSS